MNFLLLSVKILHCSRAKYKSLPKTTIITFFFLKGDLYKIRAEKEKIQPDIQ